MGRRWGDGKRPVIRPFYLDRQEDISGVSGKGVVAVGVVLPSGKCVLEWRSRMRTVTVFESVDQVIRIHGHGGRTGLCWGMPPEEEGTIRLRPGRFLAPFGALISRSSMLINRVLFRAWLNVRALLQTLPVSRFLPRQVASARPLGLPRRLPPPGD